MAVKRTAFQEQLAQENSRLDVTNTDSLVTKKNALSTELRQHHVKLEGPAKAYQEYLSALAAWTEEQKRLIGDSSTAETLEFLKSELQNLEQLPVVLHIWKRKRVTKAKEIYAEIARLAETYRAIYSPVQRFAETHTLIKQLFGLNVSVTIRPDPSLPEKFFAIIHRGVAGSFCGNDEGELDLRPSSNDTTLRRKRMP